MTIIYIPPLRWSTSQQMTNRKHHHRSNAHRPRPPRPPGSTADPPSLPSRPNLAHHIIVIVVSRRVTMDSEQPSPVTSLIPQWQEDLRVTSLPGKWEEASC